MTPSTVERSHFVFLRCDSFSGLKRTIILGCNKVFTLNLLRGCLVIYYLLSGESVCCRSFGSNFIMVFFLGDTYHIILYLGV